MHILLVEDDPKLGMLLQYKLSKEYHGVDWARDVQAAQEYTELADYDLYLLDWMLPGKSGLDLCREWRRAGDGTPILMLTARDAIPDRVDGLMAGADDYLVKPFAFEELIARIHALERRRPFDWNGDLLQVGELTLDMQSHEVTRQEVPLSLTRREFQLLCYLAQNAGRIMSREQIMNQVWGYDAEITPNAVDAAIKLLRKKVDDPFAGKLIQSVRGMGYKLVTDGG